MTQQKCLILWLGGSSENQFPAQLSFGNQLRYQIFQNFIQDTSASCLQPAIIRSSESLFSWYSTRCKKVTLKLINTFAGLFMAYRERFFKVYILMSLSLILHSFHTISPLDLNHYHNGGIPGDTPCTATFPATTAGIEPRNL